MSISSPRPIRRFSRSGIEEVEDLLPTEEPVEFRLQGVPIAVLMRTPGHDRELARGFALTEGIILNPTELAEVQALAGVEGSGRYELVLAEGISIDPERFRRNLYSTSSCGVCGKASIDAVRVASPPLPSGPVVSVGFLQELMEEMASLQTGFADTGGLHAAAAFTPEGELLGVREDVGRHNAMDKLVGRLAARRWPLGEVVVTVSGRVSFELVQKAAVAGVSVLAGVSAASSLAVDLADELGMTVVGFVRPGGSNLYTHPHRLTSDEL
ncbi:MAG: formate dehydrogenase accessory sulfurtransferase FdhD [bacterium]|nr:formate dehydrogenase accessory sulfurtransferase FdhD [bacterium]MXX64655.1 formate dehydrogenase accessory sulfurtransferase FdhD [Acidimicrobiia bacterium]MCY3579797.1 formate dehydrogenase accessory sulfurtransferase FdhD [bacterium]MCY3652490.1 formate dehydrogenase accessory sulfurtransferase FdhD [bacterium]MDE0643760.1 formate dehydrogenase accessory sulfurtransferase FdhD [bacterium]